MTQCDINKHENMLTSNLQATIQRLKNSSGGVVRYVTAEDVEIEVGCVCVCVFLEGGVVVVLLYQ